MAAGAGRYVGELLGRTSSLVITDIDNKLLRKLKSHLPENKRDLVKIKTADITKKFPFVARSFDGVLCTCILHLITKPVLKAIVNVIDRVIKPGAYAVIDFATDINRKFPSGKRKTFRNEPKYRLAESKELIRELFNNYELKLSKSKFSDNLTNTTGYGYRTRGNFLLAVCKKKK